MLVSMEEPYFMSTCDSARHGVIEKKIESMTLNEYALFFFTKRRLNVKIACHQTLRGEYEDNQCLISAVQCAVIVEASLLFCLVLSPQLMIALDNLNHIHLCLNA